MLGGHFKERIHIRWLTKEMHRNYGFCFRRNRFPQGNMIHRVGSLLNVNKYGLCTRVSNRFRCRHEGARNRDNFIAWTNPHGEQGKPKRLGSASHTKRAPRLTIDREIFFKCLYKRATSKRRTVNDFPDCGADLVAQRGMVRFKIDEWDFHGAERWLSFEQSCWISRDD